MYLTVEIRNAVIVGGLDKAATHAAARRLARERQKPAIIRDTDTGATLYTYRPEVDVRRKAKDCPAVCHGAFRHQHAIACRPARPRCRWRRKANGLCNCDRYHYPHRDGSGHCGDEAAYVRHLQTPRYRVA